jgi:hypothetical protein
MLGEYGSWCMADVALRARVAGPSKTRGASEKSFVSSVHYLMEDFLLLFSHVT